MRRGLALLLAVVAFTGARRVDACTCASTLRTVPKDGATDVPRNARLLLVNTYGVEPTLRRAADGVRVDIVVEEELGSIGRHPGVVARPVSLLDASTTYEVLLGTEVVSTFTVGDTTDDTAPTFAGATEVTARRWRSMGTGSTCWNRDHGDDSVLIDHEPLGADVTSVLVEIRRADEATASFRQRVPVPRDDGFPEGSFTALSSGHCAMTGAPELEPDVEYCARVTAFDTAGNPSPPTAEACSVSVTCRLGDTPSIISPSDFCDPTPYPEPPPPDDGGGCSTLPGRAKRSGSTVLLLAAVAFAIRLRKPR